MGARQDQPELFAKVVVAFRDRERPNDEYDHAFHALSLSPTGEQTFQVRESSGDRRMVVYPREIIHSVTMVPSRIAVEGSA